MAHLYTLSIAMLKPLVSVKRVCYFTAEILAVPIYTPWCDAPNFGHIKYLRWTEENHKSAQFTHLLNLGVNIGFFNVLRIALQEKNK
jgi:hypothetical protein